MQTRPSRTFSRTMATNHWTTREVPACMFKCISISCGCVETQVVFLPDGGSRSQELWWAGTSRSRKCQGQAGLCRVYRSSTASQSLTLPNRPLNKGQTWMSEVLQRQNPSDLPPETGGLWVMVPVRFCLSETESFSRRALEFLAFGV